MKGWSDGWHGKQRAGGSWRLMGCGSGGQEGEIGGLTGGWGLEVVEGSRGGCVSGSRRGLATGIPTAPGWLPGFRMVPRNTQTDLLPHLEPPVGLKDKHIHSEGQAPA